MKIDKDRKVVGIETCGRLPQGGEYQVGTTEGQIRGGRGTGRWEAGGGLGVEKAEGPAIRCRDDQLTPRKSPIVRGRRVPCLVVSIKVAYNQRVAPKISPKKRGERWGETAGARGSGRDIDVDDCNVYLVYGDDDTMMLSGSIVSEEEIGTERFVWGVLPDKEG